MLIDLRVRDLGVIEDLTLTFGPGMTALTGETGAGKTLLIEALQMVLGGRASPDVVRAGAEEALVEARFVLGGGDDEHEVILARSVPVSGRSRAWLDGRMVPLAALSQAAGDLVDIHGQHDQQTLLTPAGPRRALDAFGGIDPTPRDAARRARRALDDQLASLGGDAHQRARDADVARHQITEIDQAAISGPDEEEELAAEEARLADLTAHREAASAALDALEGATEAGIPGAVDALGAARTAVAGRAPFAEWSARLGAASNEIADVASDLRHVVDTWEDDPERLEAVQRRQGQLADLRRKYGRSLHEVLEFARAATKRLAALEEAEERAALLEDERDRAERAFVAADADLLDRRRAAAPALAAAAVSRLVDLAMPGARLAVEVRPEAGDHVVQLLLGANPGEPLQPLAKVASGGELARTMLALRLVAVEGPATMVFDEVDAGVGGTAALALAGALHEVSRHRQVLVVTHLPQVAAFADQQVAVTKVVHDGRTVADAASLDDDGRVVELSRMLSGRPHSATARAHAVELLALGAAPDPPG